jgi:hypothetical protein
MVGPTERKKRRKRYGYKWIGHIEVYFNDIERDEAIAHIGEIEADFEDIVSRITQQGICIKFAYTGGTDDYRVTLQPKEEDHPYNGYTLGYTHVELTRLLLIAQFIVEVLMRDQRVAIPDKSSQNEW